MGQSEFRCRLNGGAPFEPQVETQIKHQKGETKSNRYTAIIKNLAWTCYNEMAACHLLEQEISVLMFREYFKNEIEKVEWFLMSAHPPVSIDSIHWNFEKSDQCEVCTFEYREDLERYRNIWESSSIQESDVLDFWGYSNERFLQNILPRDPRVLVP